MLNVLLGLVVQLFTNHQGISITPSRSGTEIAVGEMEKLESSMRD